MPFRLSLDFYTGIILLTKCRTDLPYKTGQEELLLIKQNQPEPTSMEY